MGIECSVPFEIAVEAIRAGGAVSGTGGPDCWDESCNFVSKASPVLLEATPDPGWLLIGWGGDCAAVGTALAVEIDLDSDKSCSADFSAIPVGFTLRVSNFGGDGRVVTVDTFGPQIDCGPTCSQVHDPFSEVSLQD